MFNPAFDKVLIERDQPETVSKGGIHIPAKSQDKACNGKVKSVGPGRFTSDGKQIPVSFKVGDKVMFHHYDGVEFGDNMIIVSENSILGTLL